ncbi:MAG TPA: ferritin-like domain-containing protein [Candidatus Binatia bacterium]|nr:ferritin-like domain-containing protein [Candidatus Binatia bacterium]
MSGWREAVLAALVEPSPQKKIELVAGLVPGRSNGEREGPLASAGDEVPGRPPRPLLVDPREVPRRGLGTPEGRAALIHAVAHIEFNAINLALDASWRFAKMPAEFHVDWIGVAQDEARHFAMLSGRLVELGYAYGDFTAHDGLWEAAQKTAHDVLARMALVPRVLEARGLDVTPGIIRRLRETGDAPTVQILETILREEVRHVAIGTRWFRGLCEERGLDPAETFRVLLAEYGARIHPPFNRAAREAAGFGAAELDSLGIK